MGEKPPVGGHGIAEGDCGGDEGQRRDRFGTEETTQRQRIVADPETRGHDEHNGPGTDRESCQSHLGGGIERGDHWKGDTDRGEIEAVVGEGAEDAEDDDGLRQTTAQEEHDTEPEGEDVGQRSGHRLGVSLCERDDDRQRQHHRSSEDDFSSPRSHTTSIWNSAADGHRAERRPVSLLDAVALPQDSTANPLRE